MLWGKRALDWMRSHGGTPILVSAWVNQSGIQAHGNVEQPSLPQALAHDLKSTFRTDAEAVGDRACSLGRAHRHADVCIG